MIEELITELKERLKTHFCKEVHEHTLGSRTFEVCKPTDAFKREVSLKLYDILNKVFPDSEEIKLLNDIVHVRLNRGRDFWYKLGLALSDGSPLSRSKIIFSLSTSCTLEAVIRAFNETRVYLGRVMISRTSGKVILVFNVIATDRAVASIMRSLRKYDDCRNNPVISRLIEDLQSHREFLASFLAGAIDGDGTISEDDVRLSVSTGDPLYVIISNIFSGHVRYDSKRYLLRISTNALRLSGVFEPMISNVVCSHKKQRLTRLHLKSYKRFRLQGLSLDKDLIERMVVLLSRDPSVKDLLRNARIRKHGRYRYFITPVNKETFNARKEAIIHILKTLSEELGMDLLPALKIGTRELVIYNQDLVILFEALKKRIGEVGTAG